MVRKHLCAGNVTGDGVAVFNTNVSAATIASTLITAATRPSCLLSTFHFYPSSSDSLRSLFPTFLTFLYF